MSKRLEMLKETIPGLTRVGYLANPGYEVHKAQLTEMDAAARGLGLTLHLVEVRAPSGLEGAFARMAAVQVGAFIVQQDPLFVGNRALIIDSAARRRLPGMYVFSLYPRSGGLLSYGANAADLYRRAAEYVDRVLRGRQAIRPSGGTAYQIRPRHQPEDSEGARPHHSAGIVAASRSNYPVSRRRSRSSRGEPEQLIFPPSPPAAPKAKARVIPAPKQAAKAHIIHDCRHHFASSCMMREGNLLALSKILGHVRLSMTEKYSHLAPDHSVMRSPPGPSGRYRSWNQFWNQRRSK